MIDLDKLEAEREAAYERADLRGFYQEHWDSLVEETKRLRAELAYAREACINALGFALRDDRPIREGEPYFEGHEEAYSLHRVEPFERLAVYAGNREWAVEQAFNELRNVP